MNTQQAIEILFNVAMSADLPKGLTNNEAREHLNNLGMAKNILISATKEPYDKKD